MASSLYQSQQTQSARRLILKLRISSWLLSKLQDLQRLMRVLW
ncbi:hypothetical protein GQ600_23260 [Phytophthora cactorum]|nr:hypothetical protein GQ600_23260 [Phytophthora cactorum]